MNWKSGIFQMALIAVVFFGGCNGAQEENVNYPALDGDLWARTLGDTWYGVTIDQTKAANPAYAGTHCKILIEESCTSYCDETVAAKIIDQFDNKIYHQITDVFGKECDVDGNGTVTIMLVDMSSNSVVGYFDPVHEFERSANNLYSNETDIFYMNIVGFPMSNTTSATIFLNTLAHEFQHMIHLNQKIFVQKFRSMDDTWINEGLSAAAEYVYGGIDLDKVNDYNSCYELNTEGKNFISWYPYGDYTDYVTVYLFFQWLRVHADLSDGESGTQIYTEITNAKYLDYRAVQTIADNYLAFYNLSWREIMESWYIANVYYQDTGRYGYKLALGAANPLNTPYYNSSSTSVELKSGCGIYRGITSAATVSGGGTHIGYVGLNTSTYVTYHNPPYSGDILLVYNYNTVDDYYSSGETTGTLPSIVSSLALSASKSVSSSSVSASAPKFFHKPFNTGEINFILNGQEQ